MPDPRFTLALDELKPDQWRLFEKLAAEFLVDEFPALRSMAAASGDGGRDGVTFAVDGESKLVFQYSVTVDWKGKIRQTVDRLSETFPEADQLIYVTNKPIGAMADELRSDLRKSGMYLDVRDRSWFEDRENTTAARQVASAELIELVVAPLLKSRAILDSALKITSEEGRIALVHLALEDADGASERGLTKRAFEALVLAALDGTSADECKSLEEIQAHVRGLIPAGSAQQVDALVASAISRLAARRGPVKLRGSDYHISFEESVALDAKAAQYLLEEAATEVLISRVMEQVGLGDSDHRDVAGETVKNLRLLTESVIFRLGESFASAVTNGDPVPLGYEQIALEVAEMKMLLPFSSDETAELVLAVLDQPSDDARKHFRRIADAYTLFAFLRQTADVQKVLVSVFSDGDIWLDTSAVLPLIGESLIEDSSARNYTSLLRAAVDAGLKLYVTGGVLEEVERHINRSVVYANTRDWKGRIPFVYSAYVLSGRPTADFVAWADEIRGQSRPVDDVMDYLRDVFSIHRRDLTELAEAAPVALRGAVQELWRESHDRRRNSDDSWLDPATVSRLVDHDVENTVGVIQMRKTSPLSHMGYRAWWLTLDATASRLKSHLIEQLGKDAPASPVLSPDFLSQLFRLGPLRTAIEREQRVQFPLVTNISRMENIPPELIALADKIRSENAGLDERLIRRHVRDALDEVRAKSGRMASGGTLGMEREIAKRLRTNKR
ncbi:MAG TPA: hypothetical protein VGM94_09915 [Galbitalea sp.]|jgi:hypothetical protein